MFLLDFVVISAFDGDLDFEKVLIIFGDFYVLIVCYFPYVFCFNFIPLTTVFYLDTDFYFAIFGGESNLPNVFDYILLALLFLWIHFSAATFLPLL